MVYASTFTHVDVCDTPLHRKALDAVLRHIDRNPNRLAFVSATDSSVKITFKELYAQAHHVASFFSNKGFGHLDVCCMVMPNCIQYASIYLGALLTGGVLSGASAMFTEYELRRQFVDSECKIVVTDDSYLEKVLLTAKSCPLIKCVICVPSSKSSNSITSGAVTWDEVVSTPITAIPTYNYSPDDTALLPYSSGTTGPPKGVMLTHRNFSTVQEVEFRHFDEHIVSKLANHRWDYYEENLLLLLPFYHIYGFGLMNMVLLTGMTGVVFEKFDPILLLNNIQTHKPKMLMTVPPILLFLAKSPSTKNFDLTSIEFVLTGAAPAGKDLCDEFLCKFKHVRFLAQAYGMTECGMVSHLPSLDSKTNYVTVGKLISTFKQKLSNNLTKAMFMRNEYVFDAQFPLNGTNISECFSYVYLGRDVNTANHLSPELVMEKRAAWDAFKSVEEVVRKTKNARLRAHLFDSTVLPALTYASESWALRKQDEHATCVAQRSIERRMLGVTRFIQARDGIRSSELRRQSKIRDAVAWAKLSKIRWAGHVMRFRDDRWTRAVTDWIPRDVRRTPGRPPLRWSDFFVKSLNHRFDALRVPQASRTHWSRDRDEWRRYWRPLEQIDDQRNDR
ncbi:hypothetical protein Q1695_010991 [Nippostrongylus brasiliensis]|nr:hypothetical protein Q1695_010991 [Nippostrongylus brasiliensis]